MPLSQSVLVSQKIPRGEPVLAERVNALLAIGDAVSAYPLLKELTATSHATAQTHIIAGLTALQLDKPEEARKQFERALERDPHNVDALHNLALLAVAADQLSTAIGHLTVLKRQHPRDAGVHNDLAVLRLNRRSPERALAGFRRALRLDPNYSVARNNAMQVCLDYGWLETAKRILHSTTAENLNPVARAEISRWREILDLIQPPAPISVTDSPIMGKKIAFFATHDTFIKDIMVDLGKGNQIRRFNGETVERLQELMRWADIAWFEWCDQLLVAATRLPKTCAIICRLHSYEAFTEMPEQVDWSKVDHLVFVNRSVKEIIGARIPSTVPTSVVHNGVDLERFSLPADKPTSRKIASVGYINYKKNPALVLYCFKKLHEYNPEFTLHIAGEFQDSRIQLYVQNYLKRHPLPVFFEGWIEDMPTWYRDKQYVISTSLFESFHYSVAEGMACGVLPLIHDWYGADYLYPSEFLFGDPDACVNLVTRLEEANLRALRGANRKFIEARYERSAVTAKLSAVLASTVRAGTPQQEAK